MIRIAPPSDTAVIAVSLARARADLTAHVATLPESKAAGASVQVGCAEKHEHTRDCPEGPADPKGAKDARDRDCERGMATDALDAASKRFVEHQRGMSASCPVETTIAAVESFAAYMDQTDKTVDTEKLALAALKVAGVPDSFIPWTARTWSAAAKRTAGRLRAGAPLS